MVVIRLSRFGKKSHPTFRIVVSDKRKDTVGKYLEQVGVYNPHTSPATIEFSTDRVKHWLSTGAQPSATVHNLLVEKGLLTGPKLVVAKAKQEAAAPAAEPAATPAAPAENPPVA